MKSIFYRHPARIFAAAAIFAAVLGAPNAAACKLCDAAAAKNLNEVRKLLDRGENPNGKKNGKPAIIHAAESNRVEIVRLMLDRGANANARDNGNETGVFSAAWRRNAEIAQLLIDSGASFNHTNNVGNSPVHLAALKNSPGVVEVLARAGADLNRRDRKKKAPIHIALENKHWKVIQALADGGADLNALDGQNTPLHTAVEKYYLEVVKIVVNGGAELDRRARGGRTALWIAAQKENVEAVRVLLDAGADYTIRDSRWRYTPEYVASINWARSDKAKQIVGIFRNAHACRLCAAAKSNNRNEVRRLIAAGEDLNRRDQNNNAGLTALHHAARAGHTDIVKMLLKAGAKIDIAANFGSVHYYKPLSYALMDNRTGAVLALLDAGGDPNLRVHAVGIDEPAIVAMARLGNLEVAKKLLEKRANPNVRGSRGNGPSNSPLIWAVERNNAAMVKLLLKHNADPGMHGGHGGTPIISAVNKNYGGLVEQFVRKSRTAGEQALVHFAAHSDARPVSVLLSKGVSPSAADADQGGKTALMAAAENNRANIVRLLLEEGADPDAADANNRTVWDIVRNKWLIRSVMRDVIRDKYGIDINASDS